MRIKSSTPTPATVNMIPLMDSMFLLLVFFIYAMMSMVMHKGVPVDLPNAVSAISNQSPFHTISVSKSGQLFWDRNPISKSGLESQLRAVKTAETPRIFVRADKAAMHGDVLGVLDMLRRLNISEVSFETGGRND